MTGNALFRVRRRDRRDTQWKAVRYFATEAAARRLAARWTAAGYVVVVSVSTTRVQWREPFRPVVVR